MKISWGQAVVLRYCRRRGSNRYVNGMEIFPYDSKVIIPSQMSTQGLLGGQKRKNSCQCSLRMPPYLLFSGKTLATSIDCNGYSK